MFTYIVPHKNNHCQVNLPFQTDPSMNMVGEHDMHYYITFLFGHILPFSICPQIKKTKNKSHDPLVIQQGYWNHGPVEIVRFPIETMLIFHRLVFIYQRVNPFISPTMSFR